MRISTIRNNFGEKYEGNGIRGLEAPWNLSDIRNSYLLKGLARKLAA
ncbi:hypothetical protein [Paenibacillus sp.]|nr:hypothetical protein [Paenibacillus sp.]